MTKVFTANLIQEPVNGRKQQDFPAVITKTAFLFTVLTVYVPYLNAFPMQMKLFKFYHFLLLALIFPGMVSCAGTKRPDTSEKISTQESTDQKDETEKLPPTIADMIEVRDILNRETYPLKKISTELPVFIEVSASWCPACKEMEKTTDKLFEYFRGKVFFIRLFRAGDAKSDENTQVPVMEIINSPENMGIEFSEALPRVIVLSRNGTEIVADLTGTYPLLYYYGILSEL